MIHPRILKIRSRLCIRRERRISQFRETTTTTGRHTKSLGISNDDLINFWNNSYDNLFSDDFSHDSSDEMCRDSDTNTDDFDLGSIGFDIKTSCRYVQDLVSVMTQDRITKSCNNSFAQLVSYREFHLTAVPADSRFRHTASY